MEGLLTKLAASPSGLDVMGEGGAYIGTVTAASLVETLGRVEAAMPSRVAHG